ncbi:MAG: ROK family protein [Phycisphaeraceae bacterium]
MVDAIGIDVGGTRLKAVALSRGGEVLARHEAATPGHDADALVEAVRAAVKAVAGDAGGGGDAPIGLAAPGLAARDGRSIAWMQGRLEAVQGLDFSRALGRDVTVLNDAHAATLAEVWLGAAAGADHAIVLTLGTGVGGGVIVDGRLLTGAIGRAGHIGHMSLDPHGEPGIAGTPGSLEDHVGDYNVAARTGGRFADSRALVEAAQAGDAAARQAWDASLDALAAALASLINVCDPEVIVLGGGVAQAGEAMLFAPLRRRLDRIEWRPTGQAVRIVPATLGPWAGAIGAARQAMMEVATDGHR